MRRKGEYIKKMFFRKMGTKHKYQKKKKKGNRKNNDRRE